MPDFNLFPAAQTVGTFRGFHEGGLEFHADLILPYRNEFQTVPMHGQFMLVQLESPQEAVLGRITAFSAEGRLTSSAGEDFNIRAMREGRAIPDDLREDYLRYKVNIRVLGVVRQEGGGPPSFVASHRRLPHVGSLVAFPSGEALLTTPVGSPVWLLRHRQQPGRGRTLGGQARQRRTVFDHPRSGAHPEPQAAVNRSAQGRVLVLGL